MPLRVQPVFAASGGVSYVITHSELGVAVVIDAVPGQWPSYARRAERAGCTLRQALFTSAARMQSQSLPVPWVGPVGSDEDEVTVRILGRDRRVMTGYDDVPLVVRGLILGCVATRTRGGGQLAYILPQLPAVIGHGHLHHADEHQPGQERTLIPDWLLGMVPGGKVYASQAPEGVYVRDVDEEAAVREVTRSRILRRMASLGRTSTQDVVSALGLEPTLQ